MSTTRDELMHSLFTTALEGGIGYWSDCSSYHWSTKSHDGAVVRDDLQGFYADITELEDDTQHRVDRSVIERGYKLACTEWRDRVRWSSGAKPPPWGLIDRIWAAGDDWDYDAGDADVILQLGLFGMVVYG